MSLSYTELFGDLKALITASAGYESLATTTLPDDLEAILTQYGLRWAPGEGLTSSYASMRANVVGWRATLAGYVSKRLLDPETVQAELGVSGAGLSAILVLLDEAMRDDAVTVTANACAVGSPTYSSSPANVGDGTAYPTVRLDGYSMPGPSMPANRYYAGTDSELALNETHTLVCVRDSYSGRVSRGAEEWQWAGGPAYGAWDYRDEGSGSGPTVRTADQAGYLLGRDFDSFTDDVPDYWTLAAGAAGTECAQETGTYFHPSSCLKLTGTDAGLVQVTQAAQLTLLKGRRLYSVSLAIKASAVTLVSAAWRMYFSGTGLSDAGVEILGTSWPTSWTVQQYFFAMPALIPSDLAFVIELEDVPSSKSMYIDALAVKEVDYFGGVGLVVIDGQTAWAEGDSFTFTSTNDNAGTYQGQFRRQFGVQLPSSATPSVLPLG